MVKLRDLVVAYRKAKVDLYHSTEPRFFDVVEYEENLDENLSALLNLIEGPDSSWVREPDFVGDFTFVPKHVTSPEQPSKRHSVLRSDPAAEWRARVSEADSPPVAEFRLMARCTLDFHVLSTLWLMTVGDKLDQALGAQAYGNRLRRERGGRLNRQAPGTFRHYLSPYRRWRDDGLAVMSAQLDLGKDVVAMTADATAFYHRLDPAFLLDSRFLNGLGIELDAEERHLHKLFVDALQAWIGNVSRQTGWRARGLPVGLPASGVVANLALADLDRLASEEFKPLYYGRYVDDILIVLDGDASLNDQDDVWLWLTSRSHGLLRHEGGHGSEQEEVRARFVPDYLESSDVVFDNDKNKVFHLSGETGRFMLGSIARAINERASEWRALPSIGGDTSSIGADLAAITTADGDDAVTLRDSDQLSARRASFAIRLRDFEAYERILDPGSWSEHRRAFFAAVRRQLLVLPTYFDLAGYLPRLIKLAAACEDDEALRDLFEALAGIHRTLADDCEVTVAEYDSDGISKQQTLRRWTDHVVEECSESFAAAYAGRLRATELQRVVEPLERLSPSATLRLRVRSVARWHRRLTVRDLAHVPYRFGLLRHDLGRPRVMPSPIPEPEDRVAVPLDEDVKDGLDDLVAWLDDTEIDRGDLGPGSTVPGLAFATRPFNVLDLYLALRGDVDENLGAVPPGIVQRILRAIRGYEPVALPETDQDDEGRFVVTVPSSLPGGTRRIALGMVKTKRESMEAAAFGRPDNSRARYEQLVRVIEEAASRPKPHYLLLPELAMPTGWFVHFGLRLADRGVSLVSGVEYRRQSHRVVHNQVWAALRLDGGGPALFSLYRQDKQTPAPGEERNLRDLDSLTLQPEIPWKRPPLVAHGDFRFALLICSELTNIAHRASLRGRVDALLVPEWNQDLSTFGALVESAALDIHAFIAQANHRQFGDARIRGPFSNDWERDVVRIRGGTHDYVVTGEIDYHALRRHQSRHVVIKGDFKPTPDGFEIALERRLPPPL